MSLRVKLTVLLMILSTPVLVASTTARGRALCKTGEFAAIFRKSEQLYFFTPVQSEY